MNGSNINSMSATLNQPQQRITLKDTQSVECDECKNTTFTEVMFMRRISRILSGAPKDSYMPIPAFQCSACGHVNQEFIPTELQTEKPKLVS